MRVLLVMPPYINAVRYIDGWSLHSNDYGCFPPLGLLYIATWLRKHSDHEVEILDALSEKAGHDVICDRIKKFSPDVIGMTTFTVTLVDALTISRNAKSILKSVHVCWGGPHVNAYPEESLSFPEVDSIVLGEGERVFARAVSMLALGKKPQGIKGFFTADDCDRIDRLNVDVIENLDELPYLDTGLIDKNLYHSTVGVEKTVMTVLSSRGCPFKCTFCDVPFKKYRMRSVDHFVGEVKQLVEEGYRELFFYDDTFNITAKRVEEICERILKEGISFRWSFRGRAGQLTKQTVVLAKKAGCATIHFGVETGSDEGLKELKKGVTIEQIARSIALCREQGIRTIADFMIGLPFERSVQDVKNNLAVLRRLDPDYAQINVFQPIPHTAIYEEGVARGVLDPQTWLDYVKNPTPDFQPQLWNEHLDRQELAELLRYAYHSFYFRPKVILRRLLDIQTFSELQRLVSGALKLLTG